MSRSYVTLLFSCILISLCFPNSSAQTCGSQSFSSNTVYSTCVDLTVLNSFLHWNYNQTASTAEIAFRHTGTDDTRWVAWALNPSSQSMAGSQAIVAFYNSSGVVHAYTSPITGTGGTTLDEGTLSFGVSGISATLENGEMTIFATLQLTDSLLSTNQVWQEGPMSGGAPIIHSTSGDNMRSVGTIDFTTGQTSAGGGSITSRQKKRNIHGVLNAVSWGTLMPMGAIIARYLKVFKSADPAWFYIHIACQTSAYIVGVAGWGTGMKLGSDSAGTQYNTHRNIGIILFSLGTLQVFALLLRPNKDHKFRLYWNIYHYAVGYAVIILSIINIFEGFKVLDGQKNWRTAYTVVIIVLGCIAVVLEAFTWFIVLKRKRVGSDKHGANGANGVNGYGARTNHAEV
ncbi:auxin-induced in root cultures protein 12-like [Tripterygium wilfordii]|uniref:Cytochrome b561 and DOMON domain-containing protein n=1 Tax=Tripterygium wilfordii TaxID=458696 RepID=A0A7J7DIH7_TRIWF|nr:cytochrome b561 and DOMON domain-containing protein At5g35735-like [Tripterygium wilfordii]KAF5746147.1 auxin-induced in root cultures protein 12-like [Tripterygium wilfordii]